jgi:hypothetical protein
MTKFVATIALGASLLAGVGAVQAAPSSKSPNVASTITSLPSDDFATRFFADRVVN